MKFLRIAAVVVALGGATLLHCPPKLFAYTFIGGSLDLRFRAVRLHNNFADPEANDNSTPENQFPGYTGAPLAIWKAIVEWGSELHGTGDGDPTQPGDLGSGGANFDAFWSGLASDSGSTNDNVMSVLQGSSGGIAAFIETPISDGWRIFFYEEPWIWHDGPRGCPATGIDIDLQNLVTHEYGHALGLGHTNVPGSTMEPSFLPGSTEQRSIEFDDKAGVQALYGVKSPSKPHISSYNYAGGTLVIHGTNFAFANVEVWFTPRDPTPGNADVPVKVVGLSSNGTDIQLVPPATAGPGDIAVHNPGTSGSTLSNAFPYGAKKVVCIDGANTGYLNDHEGYERALGLAPSDVVQIGGDLTDGLGLVARGDELVLIAQGAGTGTGFVWNGVKYTGFGNGLTEVPLPPGFGTLERVTFRFASCWSALDPDGPAGPNTSLVDKLTAAMGGSVAGNVGTGYDAIATVGIVWEALGGTLAQRKAAIVCLENNTSWQNQPPVNRPGTGVPGQPNQLTAAQAQVDTCLGAPDVVTIAIPDAIAKLTPQGWSFGYVTPHQASAAPGPGGGASGCACTDLPGCGIALQAGTEGSELFCTPKTNALGCNPEIFSTGNHKSGDQEGFVVYCTNARNNKSGLLFYGFNGPISVPFQGGRLCVRPPLKRSIAVNSGGNAFPANDCSGVMLIDLSAFAQGLLGGNPAAQLDVPGTEVCCQWWGRDPGFAPPNNTMLSAGLKYVVDP